MKQFKIQHSLTQRNEKSIEKYFNDVNKLKSITSKEEVELAILIRNGDTKALDKLINANLKFVISVAKKYQNSGMELSDLINYGNLGLIKAAHRFDEKRGFKFISYAVWWIRQSIIQGIADDKRMIKIPSNKNMAGGRYIKALSDLNQKLEREPTAEEIADFMDIESGDVRTLENITTKHRSLDAKISSSEDSSTLVDLIEDNMFNNPDETLIEESLKDDINRALSILSENEKFVLKSLYGIGCKKIERDEIAAKLNYTSERIRQIGKVAEEKLFNSPSAKRLLIKYV